MFLGQIETPEILIKFHLKNLDQATSKFQPNISISTKLKIHNLVQNLNQDPTS